MTTERIDRRRLLATALGVASGSALTGCVGSLTSGSDEETIQDTDGDGVIDSEDYAPRDPNVTDRSDVELVTETTVDPGGEVTDYEWRRETSGDADAVVDGDGVDLRVHKCSSAEGTAELGQVSGDLTLSFDYMTRAEQWNEVPFVRVRVDGERAYASGDDEESGIEIEEYSRTSESFERTVSVDGDTEVVFGIEESSYCNNGDHENTYFEIDGVSFSVE